MRDDDEAERAANEALFREANERIRQTAEALDPPLERMPFLCECDDVDCREPIRMTLEQYERVRSDGAVFAILPGHSSAGDVLEEHETFVVVRKPDGGGEVARALDPREEIV